MRKDFKVKLVGRGKSGDVAGVVLPFDAKQVWGKGRVPVKGTINGAAFRTTVAHMNGEYCFCVNQQIRAAAGGIGPGDTVNVVLEPDVAPRTVEVPPDLKKALKTNEAAREAWDAIPTPIARSSYSGSSTPRSRRHVPAGWRRRSRCWRRTET